MMHRPCAAPAMASLLLLIASRALAQTVQNAWVFPSLPNNSSTVFDSSTYAIQWLAQLSQVFPQFCSDCDVTNVDLWATGGLDDSLVHLVQAGVNVDETTTIQWNVDIPEGDLTNTIQWILRFVPSGKTPGGGVQEVSSPQFYIRSASSNPTATTTTTSPTPTGTTSAPTSTSMSSGLSTGAKAGIGVGVAVGVILLVAVIVGGIVISRRKKSKQARTSTSAAEQNVALHGSGGGHGGAAGAVGGDPPEYYSKEAPYNDAVVPNSAIKTDAHGGTAEHYAPQELEHRTPVGELDGTAFQSKPAELPGDNPRYS